MLWSGHFVLFGQFVYLVNAGISYNTYAIPRQRYTPYNPRVISKVCFLKPEKGPCRANLEMFYFEPAGRICSTFKWGGCQGNGNRFTTEQECNKYCLSPPNEDRNRPNYCNHKFDYGFCFGAVNRYYYDYKWKVCKKAIYSGCGGNRNNFVSEDECERMCRIGRFRTRPTTLSDRLKKVLIVNPINASTKKSRNQYTGPPTGAGGRPVTSANASLV